MVTACKINHTTAATMSYFVKKLIKYLSISELHITVPDSCLLNRSGQSVMVMQRIKTFNDHDMLHSSGLLQWFAPAEYR